MNIETIVILGLAVWRISSLLVNEDGPWEIFSRFRKWLGIEMIFPGGGMEYLQVPDRLFPQLFSCVWCMSFWLGFIWLVAWRFFPVPVYWASVALTLSAIAIGFNRWVKE